MEKEDSIDLDEEEDDEEVEEEEDDEEDMDDEEKELESADCDKEMDDSESNVKDIASNITSDIASDRLNPVDTDHVQTDTTSPQCGENRPDMTTCDKCTSVSMESENSGRNTESINSGDTEKRVHSSGSGGDMDSSGCGDFPSEKDKNVSVSDPEKNASSSDPDNSDHANILTGPQLLELFRSLYGGKTYQEGLLTVGMVINFNNTI